MIKPRQKLKKISQEELNIVLEQHLLWVISKYTQGQQADLSFHDLRGLRFPNGVNLKKAIFVGANLTRVNLTRATCIETIFNGSDLTKVLFREAILEGAILKEAILEEAILEEAILERAILRGAILRRAVLTKAIVKGAYLRSANLEGAYLKNTNFQDANLRGANLRGANLEGSNFEGANVAFTILQNNQSENLTKEIIQRQLEISQLENKLKQAKSKSNQSQEQQEKITELEKQLELAKQTEEELKRIKKEKEDLERKFQEVLKDNIEEANDALTTALKNTDNQIEINQEFAKNLQEKAIGLILLDIVFIVAMPFCALFVTPFHSFLKEIGIWGILFLTFPILLILLIALSLLRHQKQLIAEIRHYSMLKHKIELYGGILKAAQHMANSVIELKNSDNAESAEYIQKVFDEIKTELLKSPNFDLNNQPQIFPEEGEIFKSMVELVKSSTEVLKTSTEASKAIAFMEKKP